ncbi:MAG: hypothetical protein SYR96_38020, partial [Actinomycetota bacterium]|nr:hypothetical protein [Actinomycetota bacterium]
MRVFRTILGMLALTIGLPSLLAGAGLWAAMQHRDQGGEFSAELQQLSTPGYAIVVEDVDRLLRSDAPFTRIGDTQLQLTAHTADGPAFVGIAPVNAVRNYLTGVQHSTVRTVDIGTGALPVATTIVPGAKAPSAPPERGIFWTRTATAGQISWTPSDVRGGPYSLVVMNPAAQPGLQLQARAALRPGWLSSSAWGLLSLGALLVMAGMVVLAWPGRRREIVYVVEPSQVPELMRAIGAPMPILPSTGRPVGAHRPRTLAEIRPGPATAVMAWPPTPALTAAAPGVPPDPDEYAAATAIPARPAPAPAPGEPLQFIGAAGRLVQHADDAGGSVAPLTEDSSASRRVEKPGKRKAPASSSAPPSSDDIPMFQASAVDAWVAETAPVRARETEAQAAARLAEAARRRAAASAAGAGSAANGHPRPAEAAPVAAASASSSSSVKAPAEVPGTSSAVDASDGVAGASPVAARAANGAASSATARAANGAASSATARAANGAASSATARAANGAPTSPTGGDASVNAVPSLSAPSVSAPVPAAPAAPAAAVSAPAPTAA